MRMIISETDYLSGTLQNTQNIALEKMEQKTGTSEADKTHQSVVSASLD